MVIRTIGVVFVGIAALLAGCGSDDRPAAQPTATASAADEEQIRDVLTQATNATSAWDSEKMFALSCARYRDEASTFDGLVPPMSTFPADVVSSMGPEAFAQNLSEQFTGASDESVLAVADAVIRNDEVAYTSAMKDVMRQSMTLSLDKVDNIVVKGDTATADVTVTATVGTQPKQTQVDQATLVREDGQWKDCTK